MNENYTVSIIVPIYNVERYLEKCVESIIHQSYKNIEIILVDDGSMDSCGRMCDTYADRDPRIKVIHKVNGGPSSARNAGLEIATGDYISYVDSDDFIEETFIETLLDLCVKSGKGVSCIVFEPVSENGEHTNIGSHTGETFAYTAEEFIKKIADDKITYCVWSKMFRRNIVEGLKFPDGKTYEEILYTTMAVIKAGGCAYSDTMLYNYRIREGSISKSTYAEGFDTRLITDRLSIQLEQLDYISQNLSKTLSDLIKLGYYEELLNILRKCNSDYWKREITNTIEKFKLSVPEILKLSCSIGRKAKGILKMKSPKTICIIKKH